MYVLAIVIAFEFLSNNNIQANRQYYADYSYGHVHKLVSLTNANKTNHYLIFIMKHRNNTM